jgi:HTH-type transcriptional regulator / antitoxin HigA
MNIRPIKTETDYRAALKEIEGLRGAEAGSLEGERLDVLSTLVEAYERKHHPPDLPGPIEAIKFEMQRRGLDAADLIPMIGARKSVHAVLTGSRPLTLPMIRRLHKELGIPAESLIRGTDDPAERLRRPSSDERSARRTARSSG